MSSDYFLNKLITILQLRTSSLIKVWTSPDVIVALELYDDGLIIILPPHYSFGNIMAYRAASKTLFLIFECLASFFILSACDDNSHAARMNAPPASVEAKLPLWLDKRVNMPPQQWLVESSTAKVLDQEAEVEHVEELLILVADRFDESPRMIANRVAQLEDMLLENRINETAVNLLTWFTNLPNARTPHNFSALCQYYFNLRVKGKTKDEIIHNILHT